MQPDAYRAIRVASRRPAKELWVALCARCAARSDSASGRFTKRMTKPRSASLSQTCASREAHTNRTAGAGERRGIRMIRFASMAVAALQSTVGNASSSAAKSACAMSSSGQRAAKLCSCVSPSLTLLAAVQSLTEHTFTQSMRKLRGHEACDRMLDPAPM